MWIAHGKRCVYTGELLQLREVVLDHVIPEHLIGKPAQLERVLKQLGLPSDFDLQHPLNLVPTYQEHNNQKHMRVDHDQIRMGLKAAQDKLPEVEAIKKRLDGEDAIRRNLGRLKSKVAKELIEPSLLYDFWNEESSTFDEMSFLSQQPVNLALPGVAVMCFMPEYPAMNGSLLLRFKHLEVRGCMITFNHEEILGLLFRGLGTDPRRGARKFIFLYEGPNGESILQLNNSRFSVPQQHADQLCELLDALGRVYIDKLYKFESEILESVGFERAKRDGYRLIKISRWLWRLMVQFSYEFEHGKGETEWHIFDPWKSGLRVYCETDNHPRPDYRAIVTPEAADEFCRSDLLSPDGSVWLCWDPMILGVHDEDESAIEHGVIWNVQDTFDWLVDKLIPRALEWNESRARRRFALFRRKRRVDFDASRYYRRSSGVEQREASGVDSLPALERVVEVLHGFYATWTDLLVGCAAAVGVYESVKWCLDNFTLGEGLRRYVESNHRVVCPQDDIQSSLNEEIEDCKRQDGSSGGGLDMALRSLLEIIKKGEVKVAPHEVLKAVKNYLAPICEEYKAQSYRQRLLKE